MRIEIFDNDNQAKLSEQGNDTYIARGDVLTLSHAKELNRSDLDALATLRQRVGVRVRLKKVDAP
jgi:hypothetical protein